MYLLHAHIFPWVNTTVRVDALSYRRDWPVSSDIEMTSIAKNNLHSNKKFLHDRSFPHRERVRYS